MDDELLRILEGVDEDDEVVFEDTSDEEEDELEVSVCYLSIYIRCLWWLSFLIKQGKPTTSY